MRTCLSPSRVALLAAFLAATPVYADHITLLDGKTYDGTLSRDGNWTTITTRDGQTITVPSSKVLTVEIADTQTPAQKAHADWTRVQTLSDRSSDLPQIIALHNDFLQANPQAADAPAAQKSLDQYTAFLQQQKVKVQNKWVTAYERQTLLAQAGDFLKQAQDAYNKGQSARSIELVNQSLAIDPANPVALALAGLSEYRMGHAAAARADFQKMADLDPHNVLAWNNLAILAFQFNRQAEAVVDYTKALESANHNRLLLDNIAEALHSYTGPQEGRAFQQLQTLFQQADAGVSAQMAQKGLYRFGDSWVTQEQKDRLAAANAQSAQRLREMEAQFDQNKQQIAQLENQIKQSIQDYNAYNNDYNALNSIIFTEQQTGLVDAAAVQRRDALANSMASTLQMRKQMVAQRDQLLAANKNLSKDAIALRDTLSAGQFTGVQRFMETGNDQNPPPPAAVNIPPAPVAQPAPPQVNIQQTTIIQQPAPVISYPAYPWFWTIGGGCTPLFVGHGHHGNFEPITVLSTPLPTGGGNMIQPRFGGGEVIQGQGPNQMGHGNKGAS